MKKLIISLLAAALLFTACGATQNSQSKSELDSNLTLTEVLEPDYRKNYKRITAEQLWSMRGVFSEYDELVDGYVYGDSYIIYSIYKDREEKKYCLTFCLSIPATQAEALWQKQY